MKTFQGEGHGFSDVGTKETIDILVNFIKEENKYGF